MSTRDGAGPMARGPVPPDLTARRQGASDALALTQLVREAVAAELPRQVLHLRLSRLNGQVRHDHHRRLLREALEPALRPVRSRLFQLPNGDLVAVAPPGGRHLREAEAVIALLLAPGEGEAVPGALHVVLELPRDAAALLAAVEEAIGPAPAPRPPPAAAPFSPAELAALEQALRGASLARFLRRRPVCRLLRGAGGPVPVWEEWGLAWPELRATLCPGADPAATPFLARRLRRLLDRRLLAELARPEEVRGHGPMGLSLAAATLGEPEFLRLDALLDAPGRAITVLALPAEEALAAPEDFAFARDFARARGYRLALDLPGPGLLEVLPFGRLGVDMLRLPWSPDLPATTPRLPPGPEQVVLTGADRAAAIGWGWEAGITLFEGRLLRARG
ncbi:hypothetical protein [Roseicella aerolata]|uniref:EAL domain-containing protein n=1 Tax=Roseicella aerolata TaxID=2883479 RepID=A0A9X1I8E2_9PROT|nr:hypothetical protein [Roseicella aerolata]MCB4820131.1 hypothetical protein [Roseicella aerolata]